MSSFAKTWRKGTASQDSCDQGRLVAYKGHECNKAVTHCQQIEEELWILN